MLPTGFHPFQGRPPFGLRNGQGNSSGDKSFHPFQGRAPFGRCRPHEQRGRRPGTVSIPFREELYSDSIPSPAPRWSRQTCFHPFQGRPLFGQNFLQNDLWDVPGVGFHPFQGRPLFGLRPDGRCEAVITAKFPSLSGKTSIRTGQTRQICRSGSVRVSIPFREDLYSDTTQSII